MQLMHAHDTVVLNEHQLVSSLFGKWPLALQPIFKPLVGCDWVADVLVDA